VRESVPDTGPFRAAHVFKLATFNANSIRSRLSIILDWLAVHNPDVLCVQETKCQDRDFPAEAFTSAGWRVVFRGEKSYNGVAIISREEPADVRFGLDGGDPEEARLIRARIAGVDVLNSYVPQGTAVDSPRFQYKLDWFKRLRRLLETEYSPVAPLIWAGDLNVAPEPADVYDPVLFEGSVCFHPLERAALGEVMSWGLVDVFRKHNAEAGQYTFWDYRMRGALSRNLGWRLDHIMATAPLAARSTAAHIDRAPRALDKPSDHTFLIAEFE
jgi:exodeoxyribonuclease-3